MSKDWAKITAGVQRAVYFIDDNADMLKDIFLTIHTDPEFGAEVSFGVIFSDRTDHIGIVNSLLGGKTGTVERGGVPGRDEARYTVVDEERGLRFSWCVWTLYTPVPAVLDEAPKPEPVVIGG